MHRFALQERRKECGLFGQFLHSTCILYTYLQEVCHQYWPRGRGNTEAYGKYSVTLTKQEVCDDYAIRKMEITESQTRMSIGTAGFTVTQFHFMKWSQDGVPESTKGVLEVANLVQKVQINSGNKAMVVMCK